MANLGTRSRSLARFRPLPSRPFALCGGEPVFHTPSAQQYQTCSFGEAKRGIRTRESFGEPTGSVNGAAESDQEYSCSGRWGLLDIDRREAKRVGQAQWWVFGGGARNKKGCER